MHKDIEEFHKKFDLVKNKKPHLLEKDLQNFRVNFMYEEIIEFIEACKDENLHDAADALVDLVYVAMGTACMMNLPWEQLWKEVHSCNMKKIRGESNRHKTHDVIKPKGWKAPNFDKILGEQKL